MNRRDFIGTIATLPFLTPALYANKNKVKKMIYTNQMLLKKEVKLV